LKNTWPLRKEGRDLNWVLEKFRPVPDWHFPTDKKKPTKGVIYYTHNVGDPVILNACRNQLKKGMKEKHIVSGSSEPIELGKNIVIPRKEKPKFLDMCKKIVACLEASDAEIIFFAEHDVLYHPSHFDFVPPDQKKYYYNINVWRVRAEDGYALWCDDLRQLSGLVGWRETLLDNFRERVLRMEKKAKEVSEEEYNKFVRKMGFEPGTHNRPEKIDDLPAENYVSLFPNIDVRHGTNSTASRWKKEQFRNERFTRGWREAKTVAPWNWEEEKFMEFLSTL
jgi:hypothetical protein